MPYFLVSARSALTVNDTRPCWRSAIMPSKANTRNPILSVNPFRTKYIYTSPQSLLLARPSALHPCSSACSSASRPMTVAPWLVFENKLVLACRSFPPIANLVYKSGWSSADDGRIHFLQMLQKCLLDVVTLSDIDPLEAVGQAVNTRRHGSMLSHRSVRERSRKWLTKGHRRSTNRYLDFSLEAGGEKVAGCECADQLRQAKPKQERLQMTPSDKESHASGREMISMAGMKTTARMRNATVPV